LVLIIALTAKPLIRIWAGSIAIPSTSLILWLSIYALIGIALMTAGQIMIGLERVNLLAISITLCALGVIGSAIGLAPRWGLTGLAFGMAGVAVRTNGVGRAGGRPSGWSVRGRIWARGRKLTEYMLSDMFSSRLVPGVGPYAGGIIQQEHGRMLAYS
jgi:hypothetical protein